MDDNTLFIDTNILVYANVIERFLIADDTAAVSEQLVTLMGEFKIGGKQVHDANIVATMMAYDIPCLLTHNLKDLSGLGRPSRLRDSILDNK